jgi:hypothetical protein
MPRRSAGSEQRLGEAEWVTDVALDPPFLTLSLCDRLPSLDSLSALAPDWQPTMPPIAKQAITVSRSVRMILERIESCPMHVLLLCPMAFPWGGKAGDGKGRKLTEG